MRAHGLLRSVALLGALALGRPAATEPLVRPAPLADRQLPDAAAEARARALMGSIRCLVCQGQSVADSDAALAAELRATIRERVAAGQGTDTIRRWLIDRYGDAVSYQPPFRAATLLLWAAPTLFLLGGLALARGRFRRRR